MRMLVVHRFLSCTPSADRGGTYACTPEVGHVTISKATYVHHTKWTHIIPNYVRMNDYVHTFTNIRT